MNQQSSVKTAKVFALVISAVAALVMIGWAFDISFLKSISPSWVAMRLMTALNFLLAAFILYYIAEDLEGRTGMAGVVLPLTSFFSATFMLSIIVSDIFGIRTGLEEWFVVTSGSTAISPVPGRPAVPTIFNFTLVALSGMITVLHPASLKSILSWLGGIITANAAVSCIGYLLDVPLLYFRIDGLDTVMAFHTAVLFVLFGTGLLLLCRQGKAMPVHSDRIVADIRSPVRLLATLMFGLFAIEAIVMGIFAMLPPMPAWYETLVDSTTIVALFFPFLYLLVFRPFRIHDAQQTFAQQQVEHARQEWAATFDAVSDPIFLHDAEFRLVRANRAYTERAGKPLQEIIGQPYWQIFPRHDGPLPNCIKTLHETHEEEEEEISCGHGEVCTSRSFALRNQQGAYQSSIHIIRNITERKRMEDALRKKESQLSEALRIARLGYWEYDFATDEFVFNDQYYSLHGITVEEAGGYHMSSADFVRRYVYPEDAPAIGRHIKLASEAVDPDYFATNEARLLRGDGSIFWVAARFKVENDSRGRAIRLVGVNQDITEQKLMQQELHESEEKFRQISATANDAILMMDNAGKISFWNAAAERIFGYTSEETLGKELHSLIAPARFKSDFAAKFPAFQRNGQGAIIGQTRELHGLRKDGMEIPIELSVSAVQLHGKWHAIGFIREITERKLLEAQAFEQLQHVTDANIQLSELNKQLIQSQSQLLQSEKMASIGQLAAGVAHEINNPIGYVNSNLGTLEKYIADLYKVIEAYEQASTMNGEHACAEVEQTRQAVDLPYLMSDIPNLLRESQEGLARVKRIIQDLRDFSRIDDSNWQLADLEHGMDSTLNVVWNEIKYKAEVVKEYAGLPEVECMPSQINQVFLNMLVNAAQAIEDRGIVTLRTGQEGDQVWVEIADTGKGIAPENLAHIFDPFFTTKPVGQGTGLGLSVSYGIVQKHGGRIDVSSEVGKGTTMRLWLPIKPPPRQPAHALGNVAVAG